MFKSWAGGTGSIVYVDKTLFLHLANTIYGPQALSGVTPELRIRSRLSTAHSGGKNYYVHPLLEKQICFIKVFVLNFSVCHISLDLCFYTFSINFSVLKLRGDFRSRNVGPE